METTPLLKCENVENALAIALPKTAHAMLLRLLWRRFISSTIAHPTLCTLVINVQHPSKWLVGVQLVLLMWRRKVFCYTSTALSTLSGYCSTCKYPGLCTRFFLNNNPQPELVLLIWRRKTLSQELPWLQPILCSRIPLSHHSVLWWSMCSTPLAFCVFWLF
jgi:hypothetical protein